jgi:glycerol-3-phosphate acyltransferase PlsY
MERLAPTAVAALIGYLCGSVSFALLIARAKGLDLRAVGSGNAGATNAGRALGRKFGVLVYLLDAAKGALPAALALLLAPEGRAPLELAAAAGAGAYAGHVFPVWFGFRGGKGVATYSGALLVLAPLAVLAGAGVLLLVGLASRMMSLASISFGLAVPAALLLLDKDWAVGDGFPVLLFAALGGLLFLVTHRSNLARILAGTESRIGRPKS